MKHWKLLLPILLVALAILALGPRSSAGGRQASRPATGDQASSMPSPAAPGAQPRGVPVRGRVPSIVRPAPPAQASPTPRYGFRDDAGYGVSPRSQQVRREIWEGLEAFAKEVDLTEEQWRQFLADLQESAVMFGYAITDSGMLRITLGDWDDVSKELGSELEEKLGRYMTAQQVSVFRFRLHSDLLPAQLARGNILQDPANPDAKAWNVTPEDALAP